ncbi:hypothetical protein C2U53_18180 [Citrobacter sp. CFNIH10]|nr:hypothetical protein C2U53_18180 [Citrobacter sp. CFNIH10]
MMYNAYEKTARQEVVRQKVISQQLAAGKQAFTIPDYYFVKLQNSGGHFGFFHDPAVYGDYYGVQTIIKKKVKFDYSVVADGQQHKLANDTVAYSNTEGDLVVISTTPLSLQMTVTVDGVKKMIQPEKMKQAEINQQFWYYAPIDKGEVTAISL